MVTAKNVCNKSVIVDGKRIYPGYKAKTNNIEGIRSKLLNGFLELVNEKGTSSKRKVAKEQTSQGSEVTETYKKTTQEVE